jgi:hypothetical protein
MWGCLLAPGTVRLKRKESGWLAAAWLWARCAVSLNLVGFDKWGDDSSLSVFARNQP